MNTIVKRLVFSLLLLPYALGASFMSLASDRPQLSGTISVLSDDLMRLETSVGPITLNPQGLPVRFEIGANSTTLKTGLPVSVVLGNQGPLEIIILRPLPAESSNKQSSIETL